jgi:hypothetical protein
MRLSLFPALAVAGALSCALVGCREQSTRAAAVQGNQPAKPRPESMRAPRALPEGSDVYPNSPPPPDVVPQLSDVASESGIDFHYYNDAVPNRFFLPEIMGGGAAWLDYDLDGRLDLYLTNGCRLKDPDPHQTEYLNRLFRNIGGGRFTDSTGGAAAHQPGYGQGCAAGDFDVDGFPDVYLTNYGPNALFRNNGDGTFSDVTETSGTGDPLWGSSALWFDANSDDQLDLFVANYMDVTWNNARVCVYKGNLGYCGPGEYKGQPDRLYLSRGDGTFVESAEPLGFGAGDGKGLAVSAVDLDEDLRPEVYVANDMEPNFLFTRRPSSTQSEEGLYRNVALEAGCAVADNGHNEASMGIACADFDADGLFDLFLTHFYGTKNTLYRNLGGLMFDDDSYRSRAAATGFDTLGFGIVPLDYDRDGSADLFIANGHVLGPNYGINELRPQLLRNDGRGVFWEISELAGSYFRGKYLGRGAAAADYDNDGDIDLAVTHLDRPLALLRNDTATRRHFLGLSLTCPNRIPPVGGRVVVTGGGMRQVVPIAAGGSYLCSSDVRIVVGLGEFSGPPEVEVHWPSGRVDLFRDLAVDRYWNLLEGGPPQAAGLFP